MTDYKTISTYVCFGKTLIDVVKYDYIEMLKDFCRKIQNIMKNDLVQRKLQISVKKLQKILLCLIMILLIFIKFNFNWLNNNSEIHFSFKAYSWSLLGVPSPSAPRAWGPRALQCHTALYAPVCKIETIQILNIQVESFYFIKLKLNQILRINNENPRETCFQHLLTLILYSKLI